MKYLLDTHTWIWWNSAPSELSTKVRRLLSDAGRYESLLLSSISVWEFSKLIEKRRLILSLEGREWIRQALDMPKLRLIPIAPEIAWASCNLPQPFHDDPADQIIVATAREENATILTQDERLQEYRHVKCQWR